MQRIKTLKHQLLKWRRAVLRNKLAGCGTATRMQLVKVFLNKKH